MGLQDKLDEQNKKLGSAAPKEAVDVMHRATKDLENSGMIGKAKNVGDIAPDFTLNNQSGQPVSLSQKLTQGPVVLGFYRGGWWPFCNLELDALEAAHNEINELGASLIMISPQSQEASLKFAEKKGLTMELLVDSGNKVAREYGLVYTVPEDLKEVYLQFGLDVSKSNDDDSWNLPISTRYIIGTDQKIHHASLSADYTVRPDPSETIAALKEISKKGAH